MQANQTHTRPEKLLRMASWLLALIFAGFLNSLGSLVIRDFKLPGGPPTLEQFLDRNAQAPLERQQRELSRQQQALYEQLNLASTQLARSERDYQEQRRSFNNWLATRATTADPEQDPEVLDRTRALDAQQRLLARWQREQDQRNDQLQDLQREQNRLQSQLAALQQQAWQAQQAAERRYQLRVFGARLALVLPTLLLAVWLFMRWRRHRYWPFIYGFGLFALSAFFIELVPYLPSFGGYIRVGVGIVLTVFAGIAMLRGFQRYVEKQKATMQQNRTERARHVAYQKAIQSFQKKLCPSCDRPYQLAGEGANFCIHCGLELYRQCSCGARNFAYFPYCHQCGTPVQGHDNPPPTQ